MKEKKPSLLEIALSAPHTRRNSDQHVPCTKEEVPLLVAYLHGKVTTRQYAAALSIRYAGSITHRTPAVLKEAFKAGWITVRER